MKWVTRFGQGGKLSPRYIGPFEIIKRVGPVAYKLALPRDMSDVHNIFHISRLRKWVTNESHRVPQKDIELQKDMTYIEEPELILERDV
ncbi:hypothetical protein MA16_Dca028396 [Dendrobium catenatum]|uniref:Tf2-1-like SH3-like domain-containing protein n=1 Tax=Dendrobium catenatum TaxID=906689 RepID=A0A2I0VB44_9ASPA|nr:hypothetical protein MA16_Dca028396 [Dendrobium catenatum]